MSFTNTREASMAYRLNQLKSALTISILVAMPNIGHSQSLGYQPDVISPFLYTGSGDFTKEPLNKSGFLPGKADFGRFFIYRVEKPVF